MKAAVISFTIQGEKLARQVEAYLKETGWETARAVKCRALPESMEISVSRWTGEQFSCRDALIFVGAMGIAVRAIAPYVMTKTEDPAVVVLDDTGRYCIPVLSGHLGGANELAEQIAGRFGMEAVVTTATDRNGKWAVDVFARKNGLCIRSMEKAKVISARVLAEEEIRILVERNREDPAAAKMAPDVYIGIHEHPEWEQTPLYLIPRAVDLGIGCRKGADPEGVERLVRKILEQEGLCPECLATVSTIDRKGEEEAILSFCRQWNLPLLTFTPEELGSLEGVFSASEFVRSVTGVDNVCERSAVLSGGGRLVVKKQSRDGVTVALALRDWSVEVEQDLCGWNGTGQSGRDDASGSEDSGGM